MVVPSPLLPQCLELLQYIAAYRSNPDHPYSPSQEEIRKYASIPSHSGLQRRIDYMYKEGWITMTPRVARSVNITSVGEAILHSYKAEKEGHHDSHYAYRHHRSQSQ